VNLGHGDKVGRKFEQAIGALLSNATIRAAALEIGINEKTLRRWLRDEGFRAAYQAARERTLHTTTNLLLSASVEAAEVLLSIIRGERAPSPGLVATVRTVLEFGLKGRELEDLEGRIKQLRVDVERSKTE
jgi:transposase-like protein